MRGWQEHVGGGEIGVGGATPAALAAPVAGGPAVVRYAQNRQPSGDAGNVQPGAGLLYEQLVAAWARRRQVDAVGLVAHSFPAPEDADEPVHAVVVGRDIIVPDGPVLAQAVEGLPAKVVGPESKRDPAPVVGASTHLTYAEPVELCAGRARVRLSGERPSAESGVKLAEVALRCGSASPGRVVVPGEHGGVRGIVPRDAGLEQHHVCSRSGEGVGSHATAGA